MDRETIRKQLLKLYLLMLAPAAVVLGAWAAYRNLVAIPDPIAHEVMGPVCFIGSWVTALALPLLLRDRFVKSVAAQKSVEPGPFLAFEKNCLVAGLSSALFAVAAYVCSVEIFYFAGAFLGALYAAYYYFPTEQRVAHEMRLFRVPGGSTTEK